MLTAHRYDPREIGLGGSGELGADEAWMGLVSAAIGVGSDYSDAIASGSQTACNIINKAGGPAARLLANMSGSSRAEDIMQGAAFASGACKTLFPPSATQPTGATPKTPTGQTPTTASIAKKKYPTGTVHYFDAKTRVYMVSMPIGGTLRGAGLGAGAWTTHGFGGAWTTHGFGDSLGYDGLGELGVPVTHQTPVPSPTDPSTQGSTLSTKSDVQAKSGTTPFYKKWWFWAALGGGAAVLGGGSYLVFRKK